jgi:hypothetical protein
MKSRRKGFALSFITLALAAQLTLVSQLTRAQQDTHPPVPPPVSYNDNANDGARVGIPNSACRRRCQRQYRLCLRGGKKAAACRRQLSNCLRRCPQ